MKRGFTIVEVLVTIGVLLVGILVIVSSFSMNLRESSQSRERLLADLVMENLIEEVLAHPYGESPPSSWSSHQVEFEFIVEGRPQQTRFLRNVSVNKETGNGTFFGQGASQLENLDRVTLQVSWTEATNLGEAAADKELSVDLTVRREI